MELKIGKKAPNFKGIIEDESVVKLSDYKGQKLVLYFYPKDNTPGCTVQACDLRDNYNVLIEKGYQILGVSPDSPKKHEKFIAKFDLPFSLIADEEKELIRKYGVWVEKTNFGRVYMGVKRTTFIIDEEGKIEDIIVKVKTKTHANQILGE